MSGALLRGSRDSTSRKKRVERGRPRRCRGRQRRFKAASQGQPVGRGVGRVHSTEEGGESRWREGALLDGATPAGKERGDCGNAENSSAVLRDLRRALYLRVKTAAAHQDAQRERRGKPYAGNPHVRFDEGPLARASCTAGWGLLHGRRLRNRKRPSPPPPSPSSRTSPRPSATCWQEGSSRPYPARRAPAAHRPRRLDH